MNVKLVVLFVGFFMVFGTASAQDVQERPDPGVITPDMPGLWALDRAFDSVTKDDGEIAEERAAEALRMAEENKTRGVERAVNEVEKAANRSTEADKQGLVRAQNTLSRVSEKLPEEAAENVERNIERGISNAERGLDEAQRRPATADVPEWSGSDKKDDNKDVEDVMGRIIVGR